jgi:hypothetical protein
MNIGQCQPAPGGHHYDPAVALQGELHVLRIELVAAAAHPNRPVTAGAETGIERACRGVLPDGKAVIAAHPGDEHGAIGRRGYPEAAGIRRRAWAEKIVAVLIEG